jgi:hypothetical protein
MKNSAFNNIFMQLGYKLPTRQALSGKVLNEYYENVISRLQEEIYSAQYVAFTFDLWTSNQTLAYLGVTAHYLSQAW